MTTIRQHIAYARYLARHKWHVARACRLTGCSLWRAIVHDASKFLPSEWGPYARAFYAPDGSSRYDETEAFNAAWLAHQHRNPHHWQHWVLREDSGATVALEMPIRYVREMVADWIGAGLAITGKLEVWEWYAQNQGRMVLHPETRRMVEALITRVKAVASP